MAQKPLNWGILSTAHINRALIPVLQSSPRTRLLAVASRSLEAAQSYAREWRISRAYGRYEDLLADPEIDIVYNPLPNHLHAEWTIQAVQAGKHVLCEKPLALTLQEVDAIRAAAQAHGKVVAEAFMYRHHPHTLKVKESVESGSIGAVKMVRGAFTFTLDRPGNYRLEPAMGGGSLWDVGCYPLSYARFVLGAEPLEAFGWQTLNAAGCEMSFVAQLRFPGEAFLQFESSFERPPRAFLEFVGTAGRLEVPDPFKPGLSTRLLLTREGRTETIRVRGKELYLGEVEDLCDAVQMGKPPRISLEDSRGNIAALLALIESARRGVPVAVNR